MWAGLAANPLPDNAGIEIAISVHDGTYNTDFAQATITFSAPFDPKAAEAAIEKHIIHTLKTFGSSHLSKFIGAGVTVILLNHAPNLCTRLWLDLDIVPIVFNITPVAKDYSNTRRSTKSNLLSADADKYLSIHGPNYQSIPPSAAESEFSDSDEPAGNKKPPKLNPIPRTLDEQSGTRVRSSRHQCLILKFCKFPSLPRIRNSHAHQLPRSSFLGLDSAARKCLMFFGPNNNPRLVIGHRNEVQVDAGGKIHLIDDIEEYKKTVGKGTWNSVIKFADDLRQRNVKIGFFSSTPQGGGVALVS